MKTGKVHVSEIGWLELEFQDCKKGAAKALQLLFYLRDVQQTSCIPVFPWSILHFYSWNYRRITATWTSIRSARATHTAENYYCESNVLLY